MNIHGYMIYVILAIDFFHATLLSLFYQRCIPSGCFLIVINQMLHVTYSMMQYDETW